MLINILTDSLKSWFIPYSLELKRRLISKGHKVVFIHREEDIIFGSDICFFLSCTKLVKKENLRKSKHNIVVHASDLPEGKGFSPLQWQIFEGRDEIVLTLFEVVEKVDAGPYYFKRNIKFDGTEILELLRAKMAECIIEMCEEFIFKFNSLTVIKQKGVESFYRRRSLRDDEIDITKSIEELFNHFRIADNDKYPLYFIRKGKKYYLRISTELGED